jgi:hypothetical protein
MLALPNGPFVGVRQFGDRIRRAQRPARGNQDARESSQPRRLPGQCKGPGAGGAGSLVALRISSTPAENIDVPPSTVVSPTADAFAAWAHAYADLTAAERAGDGAERTMELVNEVLRARCALARQRVAAGWFPGFEIVNRLRLDEYLLRLDETSVP